ncbi:hypothetical protein ACRN9F_19745 [Shewanella oncorhynchi]|uniref:hypothetical protein n=1 Tax=Shewanella oncorhynchi TaxID=2726434 RepID=UPI003D7AEBB8
MNQNAFSQLLQAKFESYSEIPADVQIQFLYLFSTVGIDMFDDSESDQQVIEWLKEYGLYEVLSPEITSEGVTLSLKDPNHHQIDIVRLFDGKACLFVNNYQVGQWEGDEVYDFAERLSASLENTLIASHELNEKDLTALGVNLEFWNYDDVTVWLSKKG